MLPKINALRDLGRVPKGGSGSHFFTCDDGKEYIVKFADNSKTVINEYVCGSLSIRIKLPSPEIALVNLSQELIDLSEDLQGRNLTSGYHLGYVKLSKNTVDFDQVDQQKFHDHVLENSDALYGVICFDNWVLNVDRRNNGNNMVEILPAKKMRYFMIDFGHCFGTNSWGPELVNSKQRTDLMSWPDFFKAYIKYINKFDYWLKIIESYDARYIKDLIINIPGSWKITSEEKVILEDALIYRRGLIRNIINNNRNQLGV